MKWQRKKNKQRKSGNRKHLKHFHSISPRAHNERETHIKFEKRQCLCALNISVGKCRRRLIPNRKAKMKTGKWRFRWKSIHVGTFIFGLSWHRISIHRTINTVWVKKNSRPMRKSGKDDRKLAQNEKHGSTSGFSAHQTLPFWM